MPPKLSKSAKQALIVSHLRSTQTCHTLKDLEKLLPSVASINGMQVKEFIQELTDDGKISVEKIGSGNWYWCFSGDEKKERERQLRQLRREVERVQARSQKIEAELRRRREEREKEEEEGSESSDGGVEKVRTELMGRKSRLDKERKRLQTDWEAVSTSGEGLGMQDMKVETEGYREQALLYTDNIYVLEEYLRKLAGGDREIVQAVQREIYGDEYDVEGEGLREIIA